jgi:hypothetical protein
MAGIPSEALPDKKPAKLSKITARDYLAEIACRQSFCRKVLTQPRPKAEVDQAPRQLRGNIN